MGRVFPLLNRRGRVDTGIKSRNLILGVDLCRDDVVYKIITMKRGTSKGFQEKKSGDAPWYYRITWEMF